MAPNRKVKGADLFSTGKPGSWSERPLLDGFCQ